MKVRTILIACLLLAVATGSVFAQFSAENRGWAKGPVQFIMTAEEQAKWKSIKNDAEAKAFIDLFWARRDPTPATPVNEFHDNFDQAVQYADQNFTQGKKKGSFTERGRMLIIVGPPVRISRSNPQPNAGIQRPEDGAAGTSIQGYSGKQIWIYEQAKTNMQLGAPDAQIVFVDQYNTNDWTLERQGKTDIADLTKRVINASIVSPNLTAAPTFSAPAAPQALPTPNVPAPAAAAAIGEVKTPALKTAIEEFRAAKTNPYKSIGLTYTEMITPAGDHFVPVQLYIPKSAGLTAEQVSTFFGVVEDSTGATVAAFEEAATLSTSKGDLYFDKSLKLGPGSYKATLGLSDKDGKPVVMTTGAMTLKGIDKDSSGVSSLVVSNDVHETESAALAGAAYAFGRVKIVPKGDAVFTNKDEVTYFVEIINPGIDEGTNLPKIQVKLDLVGAGGTKAKPARTISAPITDATPLPLTGAPGPGSYALMAGIPLGEMKNPVPPGEYTLKVKVFDQVKKQSWTTEKTFKLIAAQ